MRLRREDGAATRIPSPSFTSMDHDPFEPGPPSRRRIGDVHSTPPRTAGTNESLLLVHPEAREPEQTATCVLQFAAMASEPQAGNGARSPGPASNYHGGSSPRAAPTLEGRLYAPRGASRSFQPRARASILAARSKSMPLHYCRRVWHLEDGISSVCPSPAAGARRIQSAHTVSPDVLVLLCRSVGHV